MSFHVIHNHERCAIFSDAEGHCPRTLPACGGESPSAQFSGAPGQPLAIALCSDSGKLDHAPGVESTCSLVLDAFLYNQK